MVIRNQQRTALIARFQVTFREAPDWWVARGQCDYLTLAVITKLHFDGLQSLLQKKKKTTAAGGYKLLQCPAFLFFSQNPEPDTRNSSDKHRFVSGL